MTQTTQPCLEVLIVEAAEKRGYEAGRIAEREHCNNVLQQFFKTFKFNPTPTIEDAEKHNAGM